MHSARLTKEQRGTGQPDVLKLSPQVNPFHPAEFMGKRMVTTQSINALLAAVEPRLKKFRQLQKERDRSEAPRFSAFTYIQPDEVRLSRIIKDLLDPKGAHGQGDVFLKAFLALLELCYEMQPVTRVVCEEPTSGARANRRHDIFLDASQWVLSIENKPWAGDQDNQVGDYLHDLVRRGKKHWHLVYLTKDGRPPSHRSISAADCEQKQAEGRLILLSFERLREWLQDCVEKCQAARLTEFLKDFRQYIQEQLLGFAPEEEQMMIVNAALQGNHLEAALELIRSRDELRTQLKAKAMQDIKNQLEKLPDWRVHCDLNADGKLGLKPPGAASWHICFEPQQGSYGKWIYGIKCDEPCPNAKLPDMTLRPDLGWLTEKICNDFLRGGKQSDWWPYYRPFDGQHPNDLDPSEYSDWEANTKPWLDMQSGDFARNIVELAKALYDATGVGSGTANPEI